MEDILKYRRLHLFVFSLTVHTVKVLIKVVNYFLNFPSECASSGFRQMNAAGIQIVLAADLKLNLSIPGSDLQDFTIDLPWSISPHFDP